MLTFQKAFYLVSVVALFITSDAQTLEGTVTNPKGEPVPFATVLLKTSRNGVVSNEHGAFVLKYTQDETFDSVIINAFGYMQMRYALQTLQSPVNFTLSASAVMLDEIVVRAQPPEFYIREAMRVFRKNSPEKPFTTTAYYYEKIKENSHFVKADEAVFRTYHPALPDSARNQDQLLLHREREKLEDLAFMKRTRDKKEKKHPPKDTADKTISFGGPSTILMTGKFNRKSWTYLDTTQFKEFRYSFEPSSTYNDRPQMVISFTSRGKVEHIRSEGKIYLDAVTLAITKVQDRGSYVIPLHVKAVLLVYGVRIKNAKFARNVELQELNRKWYPQLIRYVVDLEVSKHYWFSPDDHSVFSLEQVYAVNSLNVTSPKQIEPSKRYDTKKEMKSQVHNDAGLKWENVNVIRF